MATKVTTNQDLSASLMPEHQADSSSLTPLDLKTDQVGKTAFGKFVDFMKSLGNSSLLEHLYTATDVASTLNLVHTARDTILAEGVPATHSFNPDIASAEGGGITVAAGVCNISRGKESTKQALKREDEVGIFTGFLRGFIRGPLEIVRGGSIVTASSLNMTDKSAAIPKVMMGLGLVTCVGSGIGSVAIGASAITSFREGRQVGKAFNKKVKESNDQGVTHLQEMLSITTEDKKMVLNEIFDPKPKSWSTRALNYIGNAAVGKKESELEKKLKQALQSKNINSIKELLTESDGNLVCFTEEQEEVDGKLRLLAGYSDFSPAEQRQLRHLVSQLYAAGINNKKEKKEAIFNRTIGSDTKKLVEEFVAAEKSLSKEDRDITLKKIITSAQDGLKGNMRRMLLIIGACILSITVNVLLQVSTGGIYTFVELAINAVISAVWLGIDGYYLYQAYKQNHSDWTNRILMLLATISVVVVGALATSFAKSSLVSIVITASMLFLYLISTLYTIYSSKSASKGKEKDLAPMVRERDLGYGSGTTNNTLVAEEDLKPVMT